MKIEEIFAEDGRIACAHPTFEARRGQVTMARAVDDALRSKHILVAQAGTGLGKTFAYLVPAVLFALSENKRVVVSTRTIGLQEQIYKKDIPFLKEALGSEYPFVAVLAKGRNNFLCRRKMDSLRSFDRGILTERRQIDELREIQLAVLEKKLKIGDREELSFQPTGELWPLVSGDGDACLRRMCPYVDLCYYYVSRRAQAKANIIVVNHALFFADIAIRKDPNFSAEQAVLEDYAAVVFDEAHHLEDVATDFFSVRVSLPRLRLTTNAVTSSLRPGGMLFSPQLSARIPAMESAAQRLLSDATQLFSTLGEARRLHAHDIIDNSAQGPLQDFMAAVAELQGGDNSEEQDAFIALLIERLTRINLDLEFVLSRQGGEEKFAYWIESLQSEVALVAAPVSLQEDLREHVFLRIESVILASATLSSRLLRRIGVDRCHVLKIESPFDYTNHALLYLPRNAMEPSESPLYDEYVADRVREIVAVTNGRALVLFTSYRSMNNVFSLLSDLKEQGFTMLKQGEEARGTTMHKFKTGHKTLLLAVSSYWEGIDVPGEALSCVILVKLPFGVPTEPIVQARCEALVRQGESPFYAYTLPQAVLRLKQGFGRLIRTAADKGVVAVLDQRLQTKAYGKAFLKELPPARLTHSLEDIRRLLT